MAASSDLYESPSMQSPSIEEITRLSNQLSLQCSDSDLQAVQGYFTSFAASVQRISNLQEPSLPVKYPRTPGYKPVREENIYNAWYRRCDIKGADTGKLAGKKIAIKDNIAVAGVPLSYGSKIMEGYTPEFDATVVTRLLDAGGHIIGKTNCENMCFSGSSFTCDDGPILNPYDTTRSSGGSSAGNAVLLHTGDVDMAVGGDVGGSIRIPASWCGIVGLKPTFGLVPYTGATAIEIGADHLGPMARTVSDCALMLEVLAGYDEGRDPRQQPGMVVPEYSTLVNAGVKGKKVGMLKEGFDLCVENDVKGLVMREVYKLRMAGALVEEVSLPEHLDGPHIWTSTVVQGSYNCMIRGNGSGYHWKGFYPLSMQEAMCRGISTRPHDLNGIIKSLCIVGEYMEQKYQNKFYAKGQNLTMMLTQAYDRLLKKYDILVMPTLPMKATKLPKSGASLAEQMGAALNMTANTAPFSSTGHPALSINAGFSGGLPVGMMMVGRHFDETTVLQFARAYEILTTEHEDRT